MGNIGAAEIRSFSAIGDTINLAARLQTYAAEGSVVIGASTYALIREEVIVRPLGAPLLKGKTQPVEVYELLGLRDGAGADRAAGEGRYAATGAISIDATIETDEFVADSPR